MLYPSPTLGALLSAEDLDVISKKNLDRVNVKRPLTFHPLLTADSPNLHQESLGELVRRVVMFSLEKTQCEAST